MEKAQIRFSPLLDLFSLILDLFVFILSSRWIFDALEKFFPKYHTYISLCTSYYDIFTSQHLHGKEGKIDDGGEKNTATDYVQETTIKREEVDFIVSNIGLSLSQEGDQLMDCMSHEEFSTLFDQTEPGLHEVKEAFSIFDKNKDGFIDAKELQAVLINLGLREGTDLDACQSMIDQHDRNQDGKIELSEFSKLLESALF